MATVRPGARFSIAEAAFSGLGLLRRKPLAALAWAVVYVAIVAAIVGLFAIPIGGTTPVRVDLPPARGAPASDGHRSPQPGYHPASPYPARPSVRPITTYADAGASFWVGLLFVIALTSLTFSLAGPVLGVMTRCAVYRAVLEPDAAAFGYLRLGAREGKVMLVGLAQGLIGLTLQLLALVATFVLVGVGELIGKALQIDILLRPLLPVQVSLCGTQLVCLPLFAWISLRLCLAGPMTFAEGRLRLLASWRLTKGQGVRLLGVGLMTGAIAAVLITLFAILAVFAAAILGAMGHLVSGAPRPDQIVAMLLPPALVFGVAGAAILIPFLSAPGAHIYRRLHPEADIASTFA